MPEEKDPCVGERDLAALKDLIETRLEAMDRAQAIFEGNLNRVPTAVQLAIGTLRELTDEKFRGVFEQFALRDKGVKETAELTGLALAAALASAEKASGRQNDSFTKQIDLMAETVKTLSSTLNDKLNDLRQTQTLVSGNSAGKTALWGWMAGAVGIVISVVMAIIAAFALFHQGSGVVVVPK